MGTLVYGSTAPIPLDDERLAYVRVIALAKLRNNESFMMSWHHEEGDAGDRSTIWLHPSIAVRFVFESEVTARIDPAVLSRLHEAASGRKGLVLPTVAELREVSPEESDAPPPPVSTLRPSPSAVERRRVPRAG